MMSGNSTTSPERRFAWSKYSGDSRTKEAGEQVGIRGYAVGCNSLIGYVTKRLPTYEVITRSLRVAQPIYPAIDVRELIANALLHQDMTITGASPLVEIFSDRVEIANPGRPLLDTSRFIDLPSARAGHYLPFWA